MVLATGSLARTRAKEAYLGVLSGGSGGRFSCKKEPYGLPTEQKKQSISKLSEAPEEPPAISGRLSLSL